jgi:hypothetical protein
MPNPNSDQLALIAQADIDRLVRKVISPALAELHEWEVPGSDTREVDEETFFAIAAAATHNLLSQEARRMFALTLGAIFERQLRFWLIHAASERKKEIQTAQYQCLFDLVAELKGVDMRATPTGAVILELWEATSAIRHGDGRATKQLSNIAPHLLQPSTPESPEGRFATVRIRDADLERYYGALMTFWGAAGATPPIGMN